MTTRYRPSERRPIFLMVYGNIEGSARAKPKDIATTLFDHRSSLPYNGQRHCACHLDLVRTTQSGRGVAAVQMRLDSVDVLASRACGLMVVAMAWLVGAGCMAYGASVDPLKLPDTQLEPAEWADLNGWSTDDHAVAFATFLASCKPFLNSGRPRDPRPIYEGLLHACRRAVAAKIVGAAEARRFF